VGRPNCTLTVIDNEWWERWEHPLTSRNEHLGT
jgi:hypothetical protein